MAILFHVSPRWAAVLLVSFLACACKPRPLVCEPTSYFEVLHPQEGAGAAPFSIERLGEEMNSAYLDDPPGILVLKRNNRVSVSWSGRGDLFLSSHLIFFPSEGLARDVQDPKYVYPMRRFSDSASERVRFGFRSSSCRSPRQFGICDSKEDNLFLAAEMTCHLDQDGRFSR